MNSILQLDIAGNPVNFVTDRQAISMMASDRVIANLGEQEIVFRGGYNRISRRRSELTIGTIMLTRERVISGRLAKDYEPPYSNKGLFARDGHTCLFCGNQFAPRDLTRDHIIPKSRSNDNSWSNSATSCLRCNHAKEDRTPEEWGRLLLAVPYTPNYAEFLYLKFSNRIKADQMEFLKARFQKNSRLL
jgi:hypothetical protein